MTQALETPQEIESGSGTALPYAPARRVRRSTWVLAGLAILFLVGLRLVVIAADTPRSASGWSLGIFVDEGYKSLDARNQALFGHDRWHPGDDYAGWKERSPAIFLAYYGFFELFGVRLESVRMVTILCFAALCCGFFAMHRKRYSAGLLLLGLAFLGTQQTIFYFSRLALFEFPLLLCLYTALFLLAKSYRLPGLPTAIVVGVLFCLATFGIKASAPLYFLPLGIGILVSTRVRRPARGKGGEEGDGGRPFAVGVSAVVLLVLVVLSVWGLWDAASGRLGPPKQGYGRAFLWSMAMFSASPLITLGLVCAFHALLVDARRYLSHPYRASLLALVLLGLPMIVFLKYQPLRYYVPFLPAFVLLPIEWLHLETWRLPVPKRVPLPALTGLFGILTWCLACLGLSILWHLTFGAVWELGIHSVLTPRFVILLAAASAAVLLLGARSLLTGRLALSTVVLLLAGGTIRDGDVLATFLAAPSYRVREISRDLKRIIPPDASVGGSWAPILTLDTDVRSLYMNMLINRPSRLAFLEPDYYLVVGKSEYYRRLVRRKDVIVSDSVYESQYAGHRISLIPLAYRELDTEPEGRPPAREAGAHQDG